MNSQAYVSLRVPPAALAILGILGDLCACSSTRHVVISSTAPPILEQIAPRALDHTVLVPSFIEVRDHSLMGVVVVLAPEDSISNATYVAGRLLLTGDPTEYLVIEGPDGRVSGVATERPPLFGDVGFPTALESAPGPELGVDGVAARLMYVPFNCAPSTGKDTLRRVAKRAEAAVAGPEIVHAPVTVEFARSSGPSFSPSGKPVWVGNGCQARLEVSENWNPFGWPYNARFQTRADRWNPEEIIERCESIEPVPAAWCPANANGVRTLTASQARTIICIDPIVVVVAPAKPHSWNIGPLLADAPADPAMEAASDKLMVQTLVIPRVYGYGTEIESVEGATWFSPTFSPEPRSLVINGEPVPIELPDGRLTFDESDGKILVIWKPPSAHP